jgi:uncharacterized protein YfiM (DUF2279 family)
LKTLLFLIAFSPWSFAGALADPVSGVRPSGATAEPVSAVHPATALAEPVNTVQPGGAFADPVRGVRPSGATAEPVHARPSRGAWSAHAPRTAMELRILALYGDRSDRRDREFPTISSVRAGGAGIHETAPSGQPLHRHTEDSWFGFDKVQHVSFSFLWTLGTQYVVVNKGRLSEPQALPISISTSAALGLSKELYDLHRGPQRLFSYRDLVADGVGILLAVGLILL